MKVLTANRLAPGEVVYWHSARGWVQDLQHAELFARASEAEGEGAPDGMTMDAEGCVWSARWGGGCLVRYAPDGRELSRVQFPARKVSSDFAKSRVRASTFSNSRAF